MWIQVKLMTGAKCQKVDGLSKTCKIEDLREKLVDLFDAPVERQKLFYRGKLLVDGHTLFDYDVNLNDVIQIMVSQARKEEYKPLEDTACDKENLTPNVEAFADEIDPDAGGDSAPGTSTTPTSGEQEEDIEGSTYKPQHIIDAKDPETGAWWEANIVQISRDDQLPTDQNANDKTSMETEEEGGGSGDAGITLEKNTAKVSDGFLYHVKYVGYDGDDPVKLPVYDIRPRARHIIPFKDVKVGDVVMVNHNLDDKGERGFWYDAKITKITNSRSVKKLKATLYLGKDSFPKDNEDIAFINEVFRIEEAGSQLEDPDLVPEKRKVKPDCDVCLDNPNKKCKSCSCCVCGSKKDPEKQMICDECDEVYHIGCLKPPLESVPDIPEWYCPKCKIDDSEVVRAGEQLKKSQKKSKMPSATTAKSTWGGGMACAGRTKKCTKVKPNHFGPIPGVEVGQLYKYRMQCSEDGVHRPPVSGIAGRPNEGCQSIALSGGYEDDVDWGDEFYYTGSGGRDLSGNKRTAGQSFDQVLTKSNLAIARNCAATLDPKNGADAGENWKKGKPIRVIRNYKLAKHSEYAPEDGNRYDGTYKVVKYWPEKGKSGFIVWRYLFRRDDPIAAPWTEEGKKRIEEMGLEMIYPEGYEEKEEEKKKGKRKRTDSESSATENSETESKSTKKKKKKVDYKVEKETMALIKKDKKNEKIWAEAFTVTSEGKKAFLDKVEELFSCLCCQDTVFVPITTTCSHNICKSCLKRSFQAQVYNCPACRTELDKNSALQDENKELRAALNAMFEGYEIGR